jgi:hypothetical protein
MLHSYKGYDKGVFRTLLTFSINVSSIILGLVLASIISNSSAKFIEKIFTEYNSLLESLAISFGMGKIYNWLTTSFEPLLIMAGQFVFNALLAIPCFLIFKIIATILLKTVFSKKLLKDQNNLGYENSNDAYVKMKSKIYGAIVGGISGFIVAIFIISPIIGGVKAGARAFDYAKETLLVKTQTQSLAVNSENTKESVEDEKTSIEELLSTFEIPYKDEFATELVYACGGKAFFTSMTNAKVLGRRTNLERELSTVENFNIKEIVTMMDKFKKFDEGDNLKTLNKYSKMMKSSVSFSVVSSYFFSQMSNAFYNNVSRGGSNLVFMKNNLATPTCLKMLKICSSSDGETVRANMQTLLDLSQLLKGVDWKEVNSDYGLLLGDKDNKGLIKEISKILEKNAKMKHLVKTVESIPVNILTKQMSNNLKGLEYEFFITEFTDTVKHASTLSESKMKSEIYLGLKSGLEKNGIEIQGDILDRITTIFIDNFEDDLVNLKEQDVKDFFLDNGYKAK